MIITKQKLVKEYVVNKNNSQQIADIFGVKKHTITNLFKKYNIPMRGISESKKRFPSTDGSIFRCTKCLQEKPKEDFTKNKIIKSGIESACKACLNEKSKKWMREELVVLRNKILSILGNKCVWCGENDFRCLQIDHINGGGSKERREQKGATTYYKYIIDEINNKTNRYQILCANCNWRKRYDNCEKDGIITSIV